MNASRIHHVLEAFAFGDAMGMPTQMLTHERALQVIDQDGLMGSAPADNPVCPGLAGATITDDTHQMLILADNLIAGDGDFDSRKFARDLLQWEADMAATGSQDLLGPSTKAALLALAQVTDPYEVTLAGKTNGAAMRIPAVACAIPIMSVAGAEAMLSKIIEVNRISHNSPAANIGCAAIATMISAGIDGLDYDIALDAAKMAAQVMCERLECDPTENYIALRLTDVLFEIDHALAVGGEYQALRYIVDEVGTSLASNESVLAAFAVAHMSKGRLISVHELEGTRSAFEAAEYAAKLGGDSDTIGAMACAMVAAFGRWDEFDNKAAEYVRHQNDLDLEPRAKALARLRENYRDVI
ncbi:MAG: hypothetical protein RLZZ164_881 [Actinomycetota bacterium]|jgi:ADP-ribosylglycohydrolase